MGALRRLTAEGPAYVPSTPTRIYDDPGGAAIEQIGSNIQRSGASFGHLSQAFTHISDQQAENEADAAFNRWREGEANIRTGLFQADPLDPDAKTPSLKDIDNLYASQMQELRDSLSENMSDRGRFLFNKAVDQHGTTARIKVRGDIAATAALQEKAQIVALGDEDARLAAVANPAARDEIISNHLGRLARGERRGIISATDYTTLSERFTQKVLREQANILSRSPEGREKLYEMVDSGSFDKLDPDILNRIVTRAQAADQRLESVDRRNAAGIKAAENDREIEIGELVAKRNLTAAAARLEYYADLRLLPSNDIEKWRKAIASPPTDRFSDPVIAGRILLDVEAINPRTTEAEIDGYFQAHQEGRPGLSLADAVKAKNQLRETRVSNQRRAEDKELDRRMREHNQAEQELRVMLGVKDDFIDVKLGNDPAGRAYGILLPELRRESYAFGGSQRPLDVVEKMRPRINAALGAQSTLPQKEIQSLYPTVQSLEDAYKRNIISQEQLDQALQAHRHLVPRLPTPAPATTPKGTSETPRRKSQSYK